MQTQHDTGLTYSVSDEKGIYHQIPVTELVSAAQCFIRTQFSDGEAMTSPEKSSSYCQVLLAPYEHEVFYALWLDTQHQVIGHGELSRGTIDSANIYPREVVKAGLAANAAAVIFAHNHPSGNPEPSQADIQITQRLKEALALVDIRVLDHLIVGRDTTSMASKGLI